MNELKPGRPSIAESGELTRETVTTESRAERLLAEYLRVWGLRDPQTIAVLSRQWVQSAIHAGNLAQQTTSLNILYGAVMRHATSEMEQWLDRITAQSCADVHNPQSCRGLLAIELQSLIDQFPATILKDGPLPTALLEQLSRAARPVVPAGAPTKMPTQSLAALSSSKYLWGWWNWLRQRLRSAR